jgi:hypothetical protein
VAGPIRVPMVVRLVTALAALALLAGCSTEEGLRAQELLQQAEAAQAQLRSSTFDGSMSVAADGMDMRMRFEGATSPEGEWLAMRITGVPQAGDMTMQVLNLGGRVSMNTGSGWTSFPGGAGATGRSATFSGEAFQQLARYVRDVRVTEHQPIDGKPKTTIAGEIDTQGLLEAAAKLSDFAPQGSFDFAGSGLEIGDIHAVLTIDESTRLLDTAFVTFSMSVQGKPIEIELRYRLSSANEPVALPSP